MKMITSKTPDKTIREFFALGGELTIATELIDNALKMIVLTALNPFTGEPEGRIVIKHGENYSASMSILVAEPPKMETQYHLRGEFFGNPFSRFFKEEYAARDLMNRMQARTSDEDVKLEVVPVEVAVREET